MQPDTLEPVLSQLASWQDEAYRRFNLRLLPGLPSPMLGVRMPRLRQLARHICQGPWQAFLDDAQRSDLYEITMLRGLVIAGAPCDHSQKLALMEDFLPSINNWAVCDGVAAALHSTRQHLPETMAFLRPLLRSQAEYTLRFAVVLLMDYYRTDAYIAQVLDIYRQVEHPGYYVRMAVAWGLSMCFVDFRAQTLALFAQRCLDPWVQNKAIQKCRESRQVSPADKTLLRAYRLSPSR